VFRSTRQRGARRAMRFSVTCVPFNDIVEPEGSRPAARFMATLTEANHR
jgi:hypothetical protein